ncbi:MAG: RsmB/NOP family class I SAM-dependent RNA methyltransferase [Bacilli bacterium]|nr:RsmB/NOP family class I SAM-dependent RNA methyltransferase [Bacilli bacterium]
MDNLKELLIKEYGELLTNEILNGYVGKYTTIRCNVDKNEVINILKDLNIEYEEVNNNPHALVLKNSNSKDIEELDLYKEGKIYLQSLSSQLPPLYMRINDKDQVLDMCAAPGSKTTEMSYLYPSCLITAIEKNKIRSERLAYNLKKQNVNNVTVMNTDASSLSEYMSFDSILLDAPCSGSGTIGAYKEFNMDGQIDNISHIQETLLKKAISLLKKDKYMIYSTCSILKEENEEVLKKVLSDDVEIIPINIDGVELLPSTLDGVLTIKPNKYYEGFFISLLHKKA